jgi:transposase
MTKEQYRYLLISKVVNEKANKNRVAVHLGRSTRQVNRLIQRYDKNNPSCFRHLNSGRIPINKTDSSLIEKIIKLKQAKYKAFTITHYCEKLNDIEHIPIKLVTLKRVFRANHIITKATRKSTIKIYKQEINNTNEQDQIQQVVEKVYQDLILIKSQQHCRISIDPLFGSVVETDASEYIFFGDKLFHLHIFVDRVTNKILAAYFDSQETLHGYRCAFMKVLKRYGAPMKLVSDYRGVFSVLRNKNDPENAKLTQFGYWCEKLGTELFCTSTSQKKPWVERVHRILQDRLTAEFSLFENIDINKANAVLDKLIDEINCKLKYSEEGYTNVFEQFNEAIHGDINVFLSLRHTRKFSCGSVFAFNNKQYFAYIFESNKMINFLPHTPLIILRTFDDKLLLSVRDKLYYAVEYEKHKGKPPKEHIKFPPKQTHP